MYEVNIIYILIAAQGGILQNTKSLSNSSIIVADFAQGLLVTNNKGRDCFLSDRNYTLLRNIMWPLSQWIRLTKMCPELPTKKFFVIPDH